MLIGKIKSLTHGAQQWGVVEVKDEYGDWVSPTMKNLGLKSKIKVTI